MIFFLVAQEKSFETFHLILSNIIFSDYKLCLLVVGNVENTGI